MWNFSCLLHDSGLHIQKWKNMKNHSLLCLTGKCHFFALSTQPYILSLGIPINFIILLSHFHRLWLLSQLWFLFWVCKTIWARVFHNSKEYFRGLHSWSNIHNILFKKRITSNTYKSTSRLVVHCLAAQWQLKKELTSIWWCPVEGPFSEKTSLERQGKNTWNLIILAIAAICQWHECQHRPKILFYYDVLE